MKIAGIKYCEKTNLYTFDTDGKVAFTSLISFQEQKNRYYKKLIDTKYWVSLKAFQKANEKYKNSGKNWLVYNCSSKGLPFFL